MEYILDRIRENLEVLFVGFNPSVRSSEVGHHFANPSNRFWTVMYEAGFTPRKYKPEEDDAMLDLGYGFTNIAARPTRTAAEVTKEEYEEGREILRAKILRYRPKAVCFVGKGVYQIYSGRRILPWGIQADPVIPGIMEFVAPSTSGLVRMRLDEMAAIFRQLRELLDAEKAFKNQAR
ncbi:mismatch-specific DNA-glycosylase [Aneurinibacillus sp. Ricciae_BoGa-3]|uniref:mismatch-specific DNA-glycosylase n=1 Tax=Aneurinibacillus sp. Ricciae_BoGa-3 TaxID=3022697 RepID=UPI00234285C4|nr:mismatch-specific DNA-glycosylase [Aneurinibacillus sp. Ricciae_BoGa-3]WCK56557.1 mismatch-specific DNA-glycosylase [Aneurinibacillus sp. Ricciae_BoGa-3]